MTIAGHRYHDDTLPQAAISSNELELMKEGNY